MTSRTAQVMTRGRSDPAMTLSVPQGMSTGTGELLSTMPDGPITVFT